LITLYIKTHNKTGLKYFGRTINEDVHSYTGSGTIWLNHLKKHGKDYSTEIFSQYENICFGLIRTALRFSRENNIVKSNEWANLKEETGLAWGGKNIVFTEERKKNHSIAQLGISKNKAVFINSEGNKIKMNVFEAKEIGFVAESKGRKYSHEVNMKKGKSGEQNAMFGKKHSDEAKIKQGLKSKDTVTCFDLDEKIMKRIHKELFFQLKNIKYVGVTSKLAKEYYENKKN